MKRILYYLISALSVITAINVGAAEISPYTIECPSDFTDCAPHIKEKLSNKITTKYPASAWKIVVPHSRFFLLGNGTLKANFGIAILPINDPITTEKLNSFPRDAKEPKKKYSIFKNWPDILAIGGAEFDGSRFGPVADDRVYKAKRIVLTRMAEESAIAMSAECDKSQNCDLYEP